MSTIALMPVLAAAGLKRVAPTILQLARPSIRLTATAVDEATIANGASKLGGLPDLPPDQEWPQHNGIPMSFIAQLRLSDLAATLGEVGAPGALPSTGSLLFFYDAKQQSYGDNPANRGAWKVINLGSAAINLVRRPAPPGLPGEACFKACALSFAGEMTLPQDPRIDMAGFKWGRGEQTRYESLYAAYPSQEDHAAIHHRLLGHPNALQDDMRSQCALMSRGITDDNDPQAAQALKESLNWQLLLQVDSDENAGMRWANNGMLYFWIESSALQAGNFDKVWVILQSE